MAPGAIDASARLTVAAPFIANSVILALGPFVALAVESQLSTTLREWLDADAIGATAEGKLISYAPSTIAKSALWTIDGAGIVAAFFPPLLGIVLLRAGTLIDVLYIVALIVVVAGLLWFLVQVPIDRYHTRGIWIFTPVAVVGVAVNVLAAGAAYAIGP